MIIKNKKKFISILSLSIVYILLIGNPSFSKSSIKWYNFNSGIEKAKSQKKHILIDLYASWCTWCKVMDKETFEDKEVGKILKKDYIAIRINMESRDMIKYKKNNLSPNEFSRLFGVQGLPTVIFMDIDGEFIDKAAGYIKPKVFSAMLSYIKDGCYKKKITFRDYMEGKTNCR